MNCRRSQTLRTPSSPPLSRKGSLRLQLMTLTSPSWAVAVVSMQALPGAARMSQMRMEASAEQEANTLGGRNKFKWEDMPQTKAKDHGHCHSLSPRLNQAPTWDPRLPSLGFRFLACADQTQAQASSLSSPCLQLVTTADPPRSVCGPQMVSGPHARSHHPWVSRGGCSSDSHQSPSDLGKV